MRSFILGFSIALNIALLATYCPIVKKYILPTPVIHEIIIQPRTQLEKGV